MTAGPFAKTTPPNVTGATHRKRLFDLLDQTRKNRLVMVTAPAGSGKTTLLAGYLQERKVPFLWYRADPRDAEIETFFSFLSLALKRSSRQDKKDQAISRTERASTLNRFTRRFFEEVFLHTPPPSVLIIDDYQEVPPESEFHEMLLYGLECVPQGCTVFVLSRHPLPPQMSKWNADPRAGCIGWNEIRFTKEETKEFLRERTPGNHWNDKTVSTLYSQTDGWIAGLMMLHNSSRNLRFLYDDQPAQAASGMGAFDVVFHYFENTVLKNLDGDLQVFLMTTSFLPYMTEEMAQKLTGMENSKAFLHSLNRNLYFMFQMEMDPSRYQYHPLFREFLKKRADRAFNAERLRAILEKAAPILAQSNLDEAAGAFQRLKDWKSLSTMILEKAPGLLEQGKRETVERWISLLPPSFLRACPELLYWKAICRMPDHFQQSFLMIREIFDRLKNRKDASAALLAAGSLLQLQLQVFDNDFTTMDPLLEWFEQVRSKKLTTRESDLLEKISPQVLLALTYRDPQHESIPLWRESAKKMIACSSWSGPMLQVYGSLLGHYLVTGHHDQLHLLLKALRPYKSTASLAPPDQIFSLLVEALTIVYTDLDWKKSLKLVHEAFEVSRTAGITSYDYMLAFAGAVACLVGGDLGRMDPFLEIMTGRQEYLSNYKVSSYHQLSARKAFWTRDFQAALNHLEIALERGKPLGFPIHKTVTWVTKAFAHLELGQLCEAEACIQEAAAEGAMELPLSQYMLLTAKALGAFRRKDESSGVELLRSAFDLGAKHTIRMAPCWCPSAMSYLCGKALEYEMQKEYALDLIQKHRMLPEESFADLEEWPRHVRIYTLGRFEVLVNGRPLEFKKKVQKKPLEMLQVMISLGAKNVPTAQISDFLWPDSEGDHAGNAFKVTLARLRRLLGNNSIEYKDRLVTLNNNHCWVDVLNLESLANRALRGLNGQHSAAQPDGHGLIVRALELYSGSFLPDIETSWSRETRARIQSLVLRLEQHSKT